MRKSSGSSVVVGRRLVVSQPEDIGTTANQMKPHLSFFLWKMDRHPLNQRFNGQGVGCGVWWGGGFLIRVARL